MAVHGGLRAAAAGGRAAPGMLVALRDVALHRDRIDDLRGDLEGAAELLIERERAKSGGSIKTELALG